MKDNATYTKTIAKSNKPADAGLFAQSVKKAPNRQNASMAVWDFLSLKALFEKHSAIIANVPAIGIIIAPIFTASDPRFM